MSYFLGKSTTEIFSLEIYLSTFVTMEIHVSYNKLEFIFNIKHLILQSFIVNYYKMDFTRH